MGTRDRSCRPFTVFDAMILVAGTSAGLASFASANLGMEPAFRDGFDLENSIYGLATLLARSALPFLAGWSLAWIVIRLRKPRPTWRRLAPQPGVSATLAAILGWAVGKLYVWMVYVRQFHETPFMATMNYYNGVSILLGGFGVVVAWSGSVINGSWRSEPGWIDRLGRALGLGWLVSFLLLVGLSSEIDGI